MVWRPYFLCHGDRQLQLFAAVPPFGTASYCLISDRHRNLSSRRLVLFPMTKYDHGEIAMLHQQGAIETVDSYKNHLVTEENKKCSNHISSHTKPKPNQEKPFPQRCHARARGQRFAFSVKTNVFSFHELRPGAQKGFPSEKQSDTGWKWPGGQIAERPVLH